MGGIHDVVPTILSENRRATSALAKYSSRRAKRLEKRCFRHESGYPVAKTGEQAWQTD